MRRSPEESRALTLEIEVRNPPFVPRGQELASRLDTVPAVEAGETYAVGKMQFGVVTDPGGIKGGLGEKGRGRNARKTECGVETSLIDFDQDVVTDGLSSTSFPTKYVFQPFDIIHVEFLGVVHEKLQYIQRHACGPSRFQSPLSLESLIFGSCSAGSHGVNSIRWR